MSLLDKAQQVLTKPRSKKSVTTDEVELAVAWFKNQVSSQQVAGALGMNKAMGVTAWAANVLQLALASKRADLIAITEDDDEGDDSPLSKGR